MIFAQRHNRGGFSLVEFAIVLGVFGTFLGGTWLAVGQQRQVVKVNQTIQGVITTADSVRSAFAAQPGIGGFSGPVPGPYTSVAVNQYGGQKYTFAYLQPFNVFPPDFVVATTCGGIAGNGANHPLSSKSGVACGTLSVCDFDYAGGLQTTCSASTAPTSPPVQFFAIQLTNLDIKSCMAVSTGVSQWLLAGLQDVFINGVGTVRSGAGFPVTVKFATTNCTVAAGTNVIDFVYTARPPAT
jgi:hypothetical protein